MESSVSVPEYMDTVAAYVISSPHSVPVLLALLLIVECSVKAHGTALFCCPVRHLTELFSGRANKYG
ncbi:hypothetical protein T4B_8929 [Trichinella pseudospiralis]|uniref:Uncharacterized protein n=1 Tax=Trichinella pseudospiralis TaxID=6337 RepID=A0A0V1GHN9_TRIPS|nr:hypothetical protein T4B_8929 [Trichinella pseudospiralis]